MKKFLLVALATFLALPSFAATIYVSEDGKNKVDIYGNLRANIGYGFYSGASESTVYKGLPFPIPNSSTKGVASHQFNYGLQANSRLGVNVKLGAFTGQVEFGANEQTLVGGTQGTIGLRQAWAMFSSKKCGWLAFGKMDTPTSMGGYISTGWDNDNSLLGYGGSITSMRRFQIQYGIAGFQIALIEKEAGMRDYSVRPAIAYSFSGNGLKGKVAATFMSATKDANYNTDAVAFGVTFGIKKQFNDLFALAFIARVGLNENRYGEAGDRYNNGNFKAADLGRDGLRFGAAFEFAISPVKILDINIGVGYQGSVDLGASLTPNTDLTQYRSLIGDNISTYGFANAIAVYLRLPIKLDAHWHLIPELGTHINIDKMGGSLKSGGDMSIDASRNRFSFYAMLQLVSIF